MRIRRLVSIFTAALIITSMSALFAGEEQNQMTPEQAEMMAKWQDFMTPGKEHERLTGMAGTWITKAVMWKTPASEPVVSEGSAESEMILGGRYLVMRFKGNFMGMEFEGMNITGYDRHKKVYNNLWLDNFGTGFYPTEGTCDDSSNVCTDRGVWSDPIHGEYRVREVWKYPGKDRFVMEMFIQHEGKEEFKSMEITYTKQ